MPQGPPMEGGQVGGAVLQATETGPPPGAQGPGAQGQTQHDGN